MTQYVYQGSALKIKNVTNANYSETINDNGIETNYTGVLTQYVASGYAPNSKTYTVTETSYYISTFADNKYVVDGLYNGTINKNGSVNQYSGGSDSVSKYVSGPSSIYYSGSLSSYISGEQPILHM